MKKDFLSLADISTKELLTLCDSAARLKKAKNKSSSQLKGKTIGLVFQKPSNRTRVSFEVGSWQLGANCIYLSPEEINLGKRESVEDVAKTLSRYVDALVARTYTHQDVVNLARHASIPIINGLSDLAHPCQGLADVFSIWENFKTFKNITVAYIGDGNNVCHSLMVGCAKVGININIATPKNYQPDESMMKAAQGFAKESKSKIVWTDNPSDAVKGVQVIYSDVWVSMGQEEESQKRIKDFKGFQINKELVRLADKNYIFMHCLPAHRDLEVTADIIDGKNSIVFDQAENRLHVQKAILLYLLGKK